MTVGERIREKREALGMSQTALADKISVSKQTLYKYEKGIITNIPSNVIEAIADTLGTTPDKLMGWKKPGNEEMELLATVAGNPQLLDCLKKMISMSSDQQNKVYGYIDAIYSENEEVGD